MILVLVLSGNNSSKLLGAGNNWLRSLQNWVGVNGLKMNVAKTKANLFRLKNEPVIVNDNLTLNCLPIDIVDSFKNLVVNFSQHIAWQNHIEYIVSKLAGTVGVVCRHKDVLAVAAKLTLDNSLWYLLMNYCVLVCGTSGTTKLQWIFSFKGNCYVLFPTHQVIFMRKCCSRNIIQYRLISCKVIEWVLPTKRKTRKLPDFAKLVKHISAYNTGKPEPRKLPSASPSSGYGMLKFQYPLLLNNRAKLILILFIQRQKGYWIISCLARYAAVAPTVSFLCIIRIT